jgi:hypothetical protein
LPIPGEVARQSDLMLLDVARRLHPLFRDDVAVEVSKIRCGAGTRVFRLALQRSRSLAPAATGATQRALSIERPIKEADDQQ